MSSVIAESAPPADLNRRARSAVGANRSAPSNCSAFSFGELICSCSLQIDARNHRCSPLNSKMQVVTAGWRFKFEAAMIIGHGMGDCLGRAALGERDFAQRARICDLAHQPPSL